MKGLIIRASTKKDLDALTTLMYEYIVDFYQRPRPSTEKVHHLISLLFEDKIGTQFVAEYKGEIVGFATLYFTWSTTKADKITVMNDLYVVERMRGENVAKQLFEKCTAYSYDNNFASMIWKTAEDNERAKRFYEKMGASLDDWISYSI